MRILILLLLCSSVSAQIGRFHFSSANVSSGPDYTALVGQWSFDEASGDLIDNHGSDDGTVTGADYGLTGKVNDAYDFERSDAGDYVTLGTGVDFGSGDASFTAWVNVESFAADYSIFGGPSGSMYLEMNTSGQISIGEYDGPGSTKTSISITGSQWVFVAFVYTNSTNTVKYWIDAATESETFSNTSFAAVTNTFGARLASNWSFDGGIDEIFIYDAAVSDAIIEYNYNNGNGRGYGE